VRAGNEAYESGRYEDALTAYQAAKDLLPSDPIVDYNIGNTLDRLGRFDEAVTASRSAAQEADRNDDSQTYVFATYAAGNHAFATNALEQARDAYIDALLRDPGDADAKHNLELVLRVLNPDQGQGQQPQPTPGAGNGTAQPGASQPPGEGTAQPGATPGANGTGGASTPGAGQPGATPEADATAAPNGTPSGQQGQPGGDATGDAESLQEQLDKLLADGVSVEDALAILDRLRQESEAARLQPRAPEGSNAADR
jgi:tetratricopeptide (TPR) repeat protein